MIYFRRKNNLFAYNKLSFIVHTLIITFDGLNDNIGISGVAVVLGNKIELNGEPPELLEHRLDRLVWFIQIATHCVTNWVGLNIECENQDGRNFYLEECAKDSYVLEFLELEWTLNFYEKNIEQRLSDHFQKIIREWSWVFICSQTKAYYILWRVLFYRSWLV